MGLLDYADAAGRKFFGLLSKAPDNAKQMALAAYQLATDPNARQAAMSRLPKAFDESKSGRQMFDEAMNVGPSGLLGKIVWHGSPHKFDKFDASKIGTGEGAQAYGHGVYLADAENVAKEYAAANAGRAAAKSGFLDSLPPGAQVDVMKIMDQKHRGPLARAQLERVKDRLSPEQYEAVVREFDAGGALYKADLPDEWIPKMLDWDKPISQQPEHIQKLADLLGTNKELAGRALHNQAQLKVPGIGDSGTMAQDIALWFQNQGIPGIRYLDGGSRTAGQGSYNYVVFPGLEDQIKILERNGIPLQGLLK